MYRNSHNGFILTPIFSVLKNAVSASSVGGRGIESFPLCDYLMQSVFLRMTGSQEQKLKCICWEMGNNDYEYRYDRFTKNKLGECSEYKEKSIIYKQIMNQINIRRNAPFNFAASEKLDMLSSTKRDIQGLFNQTNLQDWAQKGFYQFEKIWDGFDARHFAGDKENLFASVNGSLSLANMYKDHLYRHRNRTAHNTLSYQQNIPTLSTIVEDGYKFDNYFFYFSILILIDKVFMELYREYLRVIKAAQEFS